MIFTQTIPLTSLSLKLRRRKTTILIISGSLTRNRKTLEGVIPCLVSEFAEDQRTPTKPGNSESHRDLAEY